MTPRNRPAWTPDLGVEQVEQGDLISDTFKREASAAVGRTGESIALPQEPGSSHRVANIGGGVRGAG